MIPKLLVGMIAIAVLCLPFWAKGRKIIQNLSRKLLWGLCAMTAATAIMVLIKDPGDGTRAFAGILLGFFVVYTALVAWSLRANNANTPRNPR